MRCFDLMVGMLVVVVVVVLFRSSSAVATMSRRGLREVGAVCDGVACDIRALGYGPLEHDGYLVGVETKGTWGLVIILVAILITGHFRLTTISGSCRLIRTQSALEIISMIIT